MQNVIAEERATVGDTRKPVTALAGTAAKLSFGAAVVFLILLAALHIVKPELDPAWHFISEYAIGSSGWMMQLAFLTLGFSLTALFFAIRSQMQTLGGKIGLGLALVTAAALVAAAFFTTDPITATQGEMTTAGSLHGFAAMIGNTAFPLAALLISFSLVRLPIWSSARRLILWTGNLPWISLVLMFAVLGITLSQAGKFGPAVVIGWPNRLVVVAYSLWLMAVTWPVIQLDKRPS